MDRVSQHILRPLTLPNGRPLKVSQHPFGVVVLPLLVGSLTFFSRRSPFIKATLFVTCSLITFYVSTAFLKIFSSGSRPRTTELVVGRTALHQACADGREEDALEMIKGCSLEDLKVADTYGYTALHFAAQKGLLQVGAALVEKKVSLDQTTGEGETPLILSCRNNHPDFAELLVNGNADVKKVDGLGRSAIHWSFQNNFSRKFIEKLLQGDISLLNQQLVKSSKANESTEESFYLKGMTPAMFAARSGREDLILDFFDQLDRMLKDDEGRSLSDYAATHQLNRLLEKLGVKRVTLDGQSALLFDVCRKKLKDEALALLNEGVDPSIEDENGFTAFMEAAKSDVLHDLLPVFVAKGAKINHVANNGITALIFACRSSSASKNALWLLELGADPNPATLPSKQTALHAAGLRQLEEVWKKLLEKGANPDAVDAMKNKPKLGKKE